MASNSPNNINKFCKERRVGGWVLFKKKCKYICCVILKFRCKCFSKDFCVIYSLVCFCWFVNLLLIQKEKIY